MLATPPRSTAEPPDGLPARADSTATSFFSPGNQSNTCGVCFCALGKRHLNPRHHCRLCAKAVCSQCSPCVVSIPGQIGVHRACIPCASRAAAAQAIEWRLVQLLGRLKVLTGQQQSRKADDLESLLPQCEEAVGFLEADFHAHRETEQRLKEMEATLQQQQSQLRQQKELLQRMNLDSNSSVHSNLSVSAVSRSVSRITTYPSSSFVEARNRNGEWPGSCTICGSLLGKRRLNPRHHCRVCGKLVCGSCSPNWVKLSDQRRVVRACTPCVADTLVAPVMAKRLARLVASGETKDLSLEDIVELCESKFSAR
eukprot:TRINITY_DN4391_c1_g1_i7.p1 TRINITY_DN4391_c1_g1~~TRINITY_DN4391_c1_g1_i7.p1  ORF type:complete len:312 (-),score=29.63 TRINITY_DN4391_c1_g1_i7:333-1268(-)